MATTPVSEIAERSENVAVGNVKAHTCDPPRSAAPAADLAAGFERDVIPFWDSLFSRAMRMTRQRADAEDLMQETMARAYTGFATFQQGTNLKGWLFRIQANPTTTSGTL